MAEKDGRFNPFFLDSLPGFLLDSERLGIGPVKDIIELGEVGHLFNSIQKTDSTKFFHE